MESATLICLVFIYLFVVVVILIKKTHFSVTSFELKESFYIKIEGLDKQKLKKVVLKFRKRFHVLLKCVL